MSRARRPPPPRRLFSLVVSWLVMGVALMVAAGLLPGVSVESFWGALLVAAIVAALNAVVPPVLAALRLPLTLVVGFLLVLLADAAILLAADALTDGILTVDDFGWALLTSLVVAAVSVVLAVVLGTDDTASIRIAQRIARRQGIIARTDVPGIIYLEIDGLALPVLRAAMRDGNAPTMARWLADGSHRLAEWETDLSSQTGASQAGILLGSNEDIPAFRWVEKETGHADDVLGAAGLRGDRAAARDRDRPARRRRRQPRQPALGRGRRRDPHRQPDGGREALQPRLPGVPGQRRQRDPHAGAVHLGGRARVDRRAARDPARRPAARAPRRHLPADARRAVRVRARPDRVRRADRHDARTARRLRDVLQLRRGRPPLRARARRHAGGAAQARHPVRADRTCLPLRAAAVRARRPLRPRADAGRDVQAAQRLRARRAGRALAHQGPGREHRRRRRAELDGRPRRQRSDRQEAEEGQERRLRPRRRRPRLRQPRARLSDGGATAADAGGDRGAAPAAPAPPCASTRTSAGCSCTPPSTARSCSAPAARTSSWTGTSKARTRSRPSRRPPRSTCCAPTASSTSPTS